MMPARRIGSTVVHHLAAACAGAAIKVFSNPDSDTSTFNITKEVICELQ
jgi:hypothetical protein